MEFYQLHKKLARYFNSKKELRNSNAERTWRDITNSQMKLFSALKEEDENKIEESIGEIYVSLSKLSEQTHNDPVACFKGQIDKLIS